MAGLVPDAWRRRLPLGVELPRLPRTGPDGGQEDARRRLRGGPARPVASSVVGSFGLRVKAGDTGRRHYFLYSQAVIGQRLGAGLRGARRWRRVIAEASLYRRPRETQLLA